MPFGGMAVTQEPSRIMAALQSVLTMQRTVSAGCRGGWTLGKRRRYRKRDAACCTFWCIPSKSHEMGGTDGYPKQPGLPAGRASSRRATICDRMPFGWLGMTSHDQLLVSAQEGLLPDRRLYVADDARRAGGCSRMAASSHRIPVGLVAVMNHDRVSKKAGKTWTMRDAAGFLSGRNPVKTSWMRDAVGVF